MSQAVSKESETKDYLWEMMESGEEFVEQYTGEGIKKFAGEDIPVIKAGSLAILAFGIRSYGEFLFGTASLAAYYYMSKEGRHYSPIRGSNCARTISDCGFPNVCRNLPVLPRLGSG